VKSRLSFSNLHKAITYGTSKLAITYVKAGNNLWLFRGILNGYPKTLSRMGWSTRFNSALPLGNGNEIT
jgi:hypothetical protein